jgi:Family of unknown function (DUF5681)
MELHQMTWNPGESGNPGGFLGGAGKKPVATAISQELAMIQDGRVDKVPKVSLRAAIRRQLEKASEGDLAALNFIAERTEGKAKTVISGDSAEPLLLHVTRGEEAASHIMDQLRQIGERGTELALEAVVDDEQN